MATKDFGFPINFTEGTFVNTELNSNGEIRLLKMSDTYDGIYYVYQNSGYWESKVYDLVDDYTSLKNLSLSTYLETSQSFKAYTKTSNDNVIWGDYVEIDYLTGNMQSTKGRYIQIKIELFGVNGEYQEPAIEFDSASINRLTNNDYITTDGSLQLKRDFSFNMVDDNGDKIYKTTILSSKFKKIDKIRLRVNGIEV